GRGGRWRGAAGTLGGVRRRGCARWGRALIRCRRALAGRARGGRAGRGRALVGRAGAGRPRGRRGGTTGRWAGRGRRTPAGRRGPGRPGRPPARRAPRLAGPARRTGVAARGRVAAGLVTGRGQPGDDDRPRVALVHDEGLDRHVAHPPVARRRQADDEADEGEAPREAVDGPQQGAAERPAGAGGPALLVHDLHPEQRLAGRPARRALQQAVADEQGEADDRLDGDVGAAGDVGTVVDHDAGGGVVLVALLQDLARVV